MFTSALNISDISVNSTSELAAAQRPPRKDYAAAYARLQDQYGHTGTGRLMPIPKKADGASTTPGSSTRSQRTASHQPPNGSQPDIAPVAAPSGPIAKFARAVRLTLVAVKIKRAFLSSLSFRSKSDASIREVGKRSSVRSTVLWPGLSDYTALTSCIRALEWSVMGPTFWRKMRGPR
ncbi:hypothetical protein B0H13DRAFT_1888357 [Mycena leptocephala]|nr:hypothetical protein B0H13DRAFT_1888357 [Mycena leptocephala]